MLLTLVGPLITSFLISLLSIPVIIKVADLKHLMDEPDQDRKLHKIKTPTLGGVAIFAGTLFAYSSFTDYLHSPEIKFFIPALILLFFTGIKDDILLLSPWKKLTVQFASAALIVVFGDLRLTSLWGMFGITDISHLAGILLTFILIVALINAFNLIDGLNGLAGGLGLIACIFFGVWFYLTNSMQLTILSFSLVGALLGFLYYNYRDAKIFMGDTGSMILGFIISILAIKFVENNRIQGIENSEFYIKAAPGVAISAVLIPLLDMARVFFYRLIQKKNPFRADRNHIHHIMLDLGMNHLNISLVIHIFAIIFIFIALQLKELRSLELTTLLISVASLIIAYAHFKRVRDIKQN